MPIGKGVYDDLCTSAREAAKAEGAMLLIIRGERGSGFSVQADIKNVLALPQTLRDMAQQIEDSLKKGNA